MKTGKASIVLEYHERTKHRLDRYAPGPETLDWDAQPDPFRRFAGAPVTMLPLAADTDVTRWTRLFCADAVPPRASTVESLGLLFELSFALSAWKQSGPDRWALRCNPSSGNLHPTEVYLVASGVKGLDDGRYHYAPKEHALERRARLPTAGTAAVNARMFVGFSSIHWREAWKYGERAFRYCQLDIGHAIGALRYAAAVAGWRVQETGLKHAAIATLLGLDRDEDFGDAEREEPEALFALLPVAGVSNDDASVERARMTFASWRGRANRLDAHPMYRWPAVDDVARASRETGQPETAPMRAAVAATRMLPATSVRAATLIRGRRSAQHFDRRAKLAVQRFWPVVDALIPRIGKGFAPIPWDVSSAPARVHPVWFAHRIDGLEAGAYLLLRDPDAFAALQMALRHIPFQQVDTAPAGLPFYRLALNPALAGTLRTLSCHQAIAADAIFVVALLADMRPISGEAPHHYRELLREAGLIGHALYLEAEAVGLRGTGIGCYFDDSMHELLGIAHDPSNHWQVLYLFSVGLPLDDHRIASEPPYRRDDARERQP